MGRMSEIDIIRQQAEPRVEYFDSWAEEGRNPEGWIFRDLEGNGRVYYLPLARASATERDRPLYWVVQVDGLGVEQLYLADRVRSRPRKSDGTYAARLYRVEDEGGGPGNGRLSWSVLLYLTARWMPAT